MMAPCPPAPNNGGVGEEGEHEVRPYRWVPSYAPVIGGRGASYRREAVTGLGTGSSETKV